MRTQVPPNSPWRVGATVTTVTNERKTRHLITAAWPLGGKLLLRVDPSAPGTGGLNAWVDSERFQLETDREHRL